MPITIHSIYIASVKAQLMQGVTEVDVIEGKGLQGDRYFLKAGTFTKEVEEGDAGRNLTLIAQETIDAVLREFSIDLSEGRHRRNVVTQGGDLNELLNKRINMGEVQLRIDRTCPPCGHLARVVDPNIFEALKNRGGLRATVLKGGKLRAGDIISVA